MTLGIAIAIDISISAMAGATYSVPSPALSGIVDSDSSEFHPGESETQAGTTDSDGSTFGISDPTLIANLVAYADAQFAGDFSLSGSAVIQWNNHAGSGGTTWDVTDGGVSTRRPTYTSGVKVAFDGSTDYLVGSTASISAPFTRVCKASIDAGGANNIGIVGSSNSTDAGWIGSYTTNTTVEIFDGTQLIGPTNGITAGVPFKAAGIFNGTSSALYLNGKATTTGNAGTTLPSGWTIGAGRAGARLFDGDVYWVAHYSVALTPGQILALFNGMS